MLKCESHLRVNVKVSEDLFFRVKTKNMFLFIFIDLVLLNSTVSCFILFFDCLSVTFAFCIPNIVYLNLCHWSNMYNCQSKNKQKKLQFVTCNTL